MARVFLGLGSNIEAEVNLRAGIERLQRDVTLVAESPWYRSPAVGFDGPDFVNLVLEVSFDGGVGELNQRLKRIETEFGRAADAVKFSSRALDIDILLFNDLCGEHDGLQLPRDDIRRFAFVIQPLLDISPQAIDPQNGQTLSRYLNDVQDQPLTLITAPLSQRSAG
ncbi:2-amino-4-hydroxy-6-hydroxymethyldihydropteridine diphosphokinase [Thalassolituus marinus]|uniref:2-amino-4-hydroxy-6-hydroxymethyldihydropteridine diphosphokinase n=1 Tax=Thalassolituus marinus TaxID=671053 RepID=A0ABS7ZUY4_9GAMM|nr:2-amino-4-hydroxy-6-hydroxymethyldihydropteridine diphosphokinase [Thalassolituus marinus]MCA6064220.1 2-amino-4-hydroxy-6-hydroxymethyldihydropteridine diphosphokinase [Thalassolituus marinus]